MTIDLRSDTVTRPNSAMRRAMAEAEVGDDVFGEDPTVQLLEAESAAAMGKEAGLFLPSGTMANQVALHVLGRPGHEVLCETKSHVALYEMAAMAALNGMQPLGLSSETGKLDPAAVDAILSSRNAYQPPIAVMVVENTHNMAGGTVSRLDELRELLGVARNHGLPTHLDGARVFHAAQALGGAPAELASGFDTVMFCLSKGLGAPIGSMLCGGEQHMATARRVRKMFGGGLHQAGVVAAAGLVALREGPSSLEQDHQNARHLAEGLAEVPGLRIDPSSVETNIVIFEVLSPASNSRAPILPAPPSSTALGQTSPAAHFCSQLATQGILAVPLSPTFVRMVTHCDVTAADITTTLSAIPSSVPPSLVSGMHSMHS